MPPKFGIPKTYTRTIGPYLSIIRFDRPFPTLLLYLPCLFGLTLSGRSIQPTTYALFLLFAFLARSIGCVINDIADRDIDAKVFRTKNRPLPSGRISLTAAMWYLVTLSTATLLMACLVFDPWFLCVSVWLIIPIAVYPFTKRFFVLPQLFLGLVFNSGTWLAFFYAHQKILITSSITLIYIGCVVWTVIYDTIYALGDAPCDKNIGLKSSAILFGNHYKTILYTLSLLKARIFLLAAYNAGLSNASSTVKVISYSILALGTAIECAFIASSTQCKSNTQNYPADGHASNKKPISNILLFDVSFLHGIILEVFILVSAHHT